MIPSLPQAQILDGVAHIRISQSPVTLDDDFYAVFIGGHMLPTRFKSWVVAHQHYLSEAVEPAVRNLVRRRAAQA